MYPNNISDIKNLSELQSNGSDIVYKSTKINLENNSYESSIHKLSKNKLKENYFARVSTIGKGETPTRLKFGLNIGQNKITRNNRFFNLLDKWQEVCVLLFY